MFKYKIMHVLRVKPSDLLMFNEFGISNNPKIPAVKTSTLPFKISLRSVMTEVRDQGRGSMCASFAAVANFEFIIKNGSGGTLVENDIDLSESHITHAVEKIHGDCVAGLAFAEIAYYLHFNGIISENAWVYNENEICSNTPPNLATTKRYYWNWNALNFDFVFHHRDNDEIRKNMHNECQGRKITLNNKFVDAARQHLGLKKKPVVADVPVFFHKNGYDAGWETGRIEMPTPLQLENWLASSSESSRSFPGESGWHAICLTGYNEGLKRFSFKNSWGAYWGYSGYGTIPYEYIAAYTRDVWPIDGSYTTGIGPPEFGI